MEGERILKCLANGNILSFKEVETYLKLIHKSDSSKIVAFIRNVLRAVLSYLKPLKSLSFKEEESITSVCVLCLKFLKGHASSNCNSVEVECALYYIIERYLSLKQLKEAIKLASYMQPLIVGCDLYSPSKKTELQAVANNVFYLFRKIAAEEESESDDNSKYTIALQLREVALDFGVMCPGEIQFLASKMQRALQQYCSDKNHTFDSKYVVAFLNKIFNCLLSKLPFRTLSLQQKFLYLQLIHKCDVFLAKRANYMDVLSHIPSWLHSLRNENGDESDSSNQTKLFNISVDLSICSFEFVIFQKPVPLELLSEWNQVLNTEISSAEIEIVYQMCSFVSHRLYVLILEQMKGEAILKYIATAAEFTSYFSALCFPYDVCSSAHPVDQCNSVIGIGNIGILCVKKNLYKEAIPFFIFSIDFQLSQERSIDLECLWKKQELLIFCYYMTAEYEEALVNVAKAYAIHKDKVNQCIKLWLKTKKISYFSEKRVNIARTTIYDIAKKHNIDLSHDRCFEFLMQEIKSCNSDRRNVGDECSAIITSLLKICPKGLSRAHVLVLELEYYITHHAESLLSSDLISSCEDKCQEALKIFEKWIAKNPNDVPVKLDLSVLYFWMYLVKWMKQQQIATSEIEKPVEVLDPDDGMTDTVGHIEEKDKNEKCDVAARFASVTAEAEMELLAILKQAVAIWLFISTSSDRTPWSKVLDVVHSLNLLNIVKATAKYFAQSANDYNELRTLIVLREIAKADDNQTFELAALHSIVSVVTRLGYLNMAAAIINYIEENLLPSENSRDDTFHTEKLKFYIAKSNYCFQTEQFQQGLDILVGVLKDPFLELNQRTPMLLKADAHLLSSMYLLLPPAAFISGTLPTVHFPDDTPLIIAVKSLKILLKLVKHKKVPEKKSSYSSDMSYAPELVCLLMKSSVVVGKLYQDIGAPCEARCFLQECLLVSQKCILTYWSSKVLTTLAHIDLLCDSFEDCEVKLNGLKHMLNISSQASNVASVPPRKNVLMIPTELKNDADLSPENDFLRTRAGRSRKGWIRQQMLKAETDGMSPVMKRWLSKDQFDVHSHAESCTCEYCEFYALQMINLETAVLSGQFLLAQGEIKEACNKLNEVLKTHAIITHNSILSKTFSLLKDISAADACAKVLPKSDLSVFVFSLISLSQICMEQGNFSATLSYISAAHEKLNVCAKNSKYLYADLHGSLIYCKTASIVRILTASNEVANSSWLSNTWLGKKSSPISLAIPELVDELTNLNFGCNTPKDEKLPLISVRDFSSLSHVLSGKPSVTAQLCKAPRKRNLMTAMKNFLNAPESSPKSNYISSCSSGLDLNCSDNGDDDCAFVSPNVLDSDPKDEQEKMPLSSKGRHPAKSRAKQLSSKTSTTTPARKLPQKRNPSRKAKCLSSRKPVLKESTTKSASPEIVFKFFKSKSDFSIKCSEDIWSQSLGECSESQPVCSPLAKNKKVKSKSTTGKATTISCRSTRSRHQTKSKKVLVVEDNVTSSSVDVSEMETEHLFAKESKSSLTSGKSLLSQKASDEKYIVEKARGGVHLAKDTERYKDSRNFTSEDWCEKEEAKFSIARSSVSEPYTPKFMGVSCGQTYSTKVSLADAGNMDFSKITALEELISELKEAVSLLEHHPPCPLYANMCLLLALLSSKIKENCDEDHENKLDMCYLISESFAVTLRHQGSIRLSKSMRDPEAATSSKNIVTKQQNLSFLKWIGSQPFADRMKQLQHVLPAEWTVVQVHAFPDFLNISKRTSKMQPPKLILCQYHQDSIPRVAVIDNNADPLFANNFLSLFEKIIHESSLTMTNKDAREWWTIRRSLDMQMKELTESMEDTWLGCWKGLFLGLPSSEERIQQLYKSVMQVISHAKSLGCSQVDKGMLQAILDSANLLSDLQLSTAVAHLWNLSPTDSALQDLTKLIRTASDSFAPTSRRPVLLVLDKDVQALPWESMRMLKDVPVTRVPSVSLLNAQLQSLSLLENPVFFHGIESEKTFYIVNPGGDLLKTQKMFEDVFKQQKGWNGILGRIPTSEEFVSAITCYDLFLYLGHGTGKNYLVGESIDKHKCQSATLLMGCSSGRLKLLGKQLEPCGVVLQYFLGGSPCIVGNLWDVTDKDIDRFTQTLLETWLPCYGKQSEPFVDVARAISFARTSCKLPYLIGAAPVVYGLPIFPRG